MIYVDIKLLFVFIFILLFSVFYYGILSFIVLSVFYLILCIACIIVVLVLLACILMQSTYV